MSKDRKLIFVVALSSAFVGSLTTLFLQDVTRDGAEGKTLSRKSDPQNPPKPQWPMSHADGANVQSPAAAGGQTALAAQTPRPTLENPPQLKQVRDEVLADPHTTPKTLLAFAEEVSTQMEGAFANKEVRYTVSRQLIACARDGQARESAQAARALCLYNLERLKERFPEELSPSYQSLIAELPEDLIFVSGVAKETEEK